jgi:hypothetical protein
MLQSVKALRGGAIVARDERFGFIVDMYFEDESWRLRYIVLDTGRPMPQRSVLIGPEFIARIDPAEASLHVSLTRAQIEKSPDWTTDLPLYLQHDMAPVGRCGDEHLRSSQVIAGYSVEALDGSAGHVADLLLDTQTLTMAWVAVDPHHWFAGKRILVSPADVQSIDGAKRKMRLRTTHAALASSNTGGPGA